MVSHVLEGETLTKLTYLPDFEKQASGDKEGALALHHKIKEYTARKEAIHAYLGATGFTLAPTAPLPVSGEGVRESGKDVLPDVPTSHTTSAPSLQLVYVIHHAFLKFFSSC